MTTKDDQNQHEGAEEEAPTVSDGPPMSSFSEAPPSEPGGDFVPPAAEAKKPVPGEDGYTLGDEPEQHATEGVHPEAELAAKRAAKPALAEAEEPHQTKAAHEKWALHFGMLPVMLEEAVIKWKTAKSIPGKLNPKFDAYNKAKAHGNWAPHFEVTEAEFLKAVADADAHVFGSPARSPQN